MKRPDKESMIYVLKYIDDFIDNIGGGESYWIAPNGETFNSDVGYCVEFPKQVIDYLRRNAN